MAQHDRRRARPNLVVSGGAEDATDSGLDAKGLKVIPGNELDIEAFGVAVDGHGLASVVRARDGFECGRLSQILAKGIRNDALTIVIAEIRTVGPDHYETRRIFHGQQAQQELIEQREDGGVRADADGECGDRDGCEKGIEAELASAVANVAPETFEPVERLGLVAIFVMHGEIAELAACGRGGVAA